MSKVQFILISSVIGFYAALFGYLISKVCADLWRARGQAAPRMQKVSHAMRVARKRAWTNAVSRGRLAWESSSKAGSAVSAAQSSHSTVLC